MLRRKNLIGIGLAVLCLLAGPIELWAGSVYLNGVKIDAVRNQKFKNVNVRIDSQGNVYITGSQYKVRMKKKDGTLTKPKTANRAQPSASIGQPKPPALGSVGPLPRKKYIAVVQRDIAKGGGFSLKIHINGRLAGIVKLGSEQEVFRLTPFLQRGDNKVMIEAFKENVKVKGSVSVLMGEGKIENGKVLIRKPYLLQYLRKAADVKNYRHIYDISIE